MAEKPIFPSVLVFASFQNLDVPIGGNTGEKFVDYTWPS